MKKNKIFQYFLTIPVIIYSIFLILIPLLYILFLSFCKNDSYGGVIYEPTLSNYFTMTGQNTKSSMVYMITKDKKLYTKQIGSSINVIPTISIEKNILTKGNGTIDSPFEME